MTRRNEVLRNARIRREGTVGKALPERIVVGAPLDAQLGDGVSSHHAYHGRIAAQGVDNFDTLFVTGIAIYFTAQFIVHAGMNMGLMPITGTTLPFMSYGGTALVTLGIGAGILMSVQRHKKLVQT